MDSVTMFIITMNMIYILPVFSSVKLIENDKNKKSYVCWWWCWLWEPICLIFINNKNSKKSWTDNAPCQASVNTLSCQLSNNSPSKHHHCSDALGKQAKRLKHNWQPRISIFGHNLNLAYLLFISFLINSKLADGRSKCCGV